MTGTEYVSPIQAINWIVFGDFVAFVPIRGENSQVDTLFEEAECELLKALRKELLKLHGKRHSEDECFQTVPLGYLQNDSAKFDFEESELGCPLPESLQATFRKRNDWLLLKFTKTDVVKVFPRMPAIPKQTIVRTPKAHYSDEEKLRFAIEWLQRPTRSQPDFRKAFRTKFSGKEREADQLYSHACRELGITRGRPKSSSRR